MVGTCDVCGKKDEIYVCTSTFGAMSNGYCKDCLNKGLEPYNTLVAYIACAGRFPSEINETYRQHCRNILKGLGISEEQFIKDVDASIKEMDEYYSQVENQVFE